MVALWLKDKKGQKLSIRIFLISIIETKSINQTVQPNRTQNIDILKEMPFATSIKSFLYQPVFSLAQRKREIPQRSCSFLQKNLTMVKWETQNGYNALFVLILNTRKNKYFESITETCIRQLRKHFQLLPKDLGVIISIVLINHKPELGVQKIMKRAFYQTNFVIYMMVYIVGNYPMLIQFIRKTKQETFINIDKALSLQQAKQFL